MPQLALAELFLAIGGKVIVGKLALMHLGCLIEHIVQLEPVVELKPSVRFTESSQERDLVERFVGVCAANSAIRSRACFMSAIG